MFNNTKNSLKSSSILIFHEIEHFAEGLKRIPLFFRNGFFPIPDIQFLGFIQRNDPRPFQHGYIISIRDGGIKTEEGEI